MSELEKILTKNEAELKPIYLIYGEDKYLLDDFTKKFIDKFVKKDIKDFNLTFLEEDDYFVINLKNRVNTLPVMAEKRYVIVRCKDYFTKKTNEDKSLIKLFSNFPETTILLIVIEGKIDKRLKVIEEINKVGQIIELVPLRYKQLDQWIIDEFKKRGKKIDGRSVKLLEQMFNNELQRLDSEIEKIVTYKYKDEKITFHDVKNIISKDRLLEDSVIFSFVDALSEKNKGQAVILLNEMMQEGEEPLKILAMIIRQIRLLLSVKVLKERGKNPNIIAKILKEHPYPVKKCYHQSDNFTEEELEMMLERFLQANLEMVTGKYKDNKMALEMALLEYKEGLFS